ncbi:hypothetical protein CBM2634_B50017 [Cupriavidus taiwanensis]|uniref:Uncharacterized protein n=1 Tax=Cupriavidus taiwanensis TaxID=164546 RepID=A0A375J8V4_9BURK|nr:hypothetical protein CBM2634_B50017 [Cupriavidus taiwanensis]
MRIHELVDHEEDIHCFGIAYAYGCGVRTCYWRAH